MVKALSLKMQTVRGVLWNLADLSLRKGVTGITTLVLAWFLTPEDFGLVAMMAIFLAFSNVLVDAGLSQALIRKHTVTNREYDTAFFTNIALAVVIYGVLYLSAPVVAQFYDQTELIDLIRITGITVIFSGFSVVQRVAMSRELNFKLQMQVSIPAALISGVAAILLAYLDFGVWALASQLLIQSLMTTLLYWRSVIIRPKFKFGWAEFKELFSFSGYLLLAHSINIPFKYMYLVVIAKLFSVQILGLYYFAEKIKRLVVEQLVSAIQTVTYPALAKIQEEPKRLKESYRQVISVMTFLLFPILIFLVALMDNVFFVLMPDRWLDAALYLQLMCLASVMYPINSVNINILKVTGRSDLVLYLEILKKGLALTIFLFSIKYGIAGILIGQIINSILAYIPNSYFSSQLIGYSIAEQLDDFFPLLIITGLIGGVLWLLQNSLQWSPLVELSALSAVGLTVYITAASLMKLKPTLLIIDLIRSKVS